MVAKTFEIAFSGDIASVIQRARGAAAEAGATMIGDIHAGTFAGRGVEGSYRVYGQMVAVTIAKKPIFVTDSFIESQLRTFFA